MLTVCLRNRMRVPGGLSLKTSSYAKFSLASQSPGVVYPPMARTDRCHSPMPVLTLKSTPPLDGHSLAILSHPAISMEVCDCGRFQTMWSGLLSLSLIYTPCPLADFGAHLLCLPSSALSPEGMPGLRRRFP